MNNDRSNYAVLIFSCPDRKGIVASVSKILFENGANILESDQYSTKSAVPYFFMRIVFEADDLPSQTDKIGKDLAELTKEFKINFKINPAGIKKNMAIFVSKDDHCLYELLWQWKSGDLPINIPCIISNHAVLSPAAKFYGVPFMYMPPDLPKKEAEKAMLSELKKLNADFAVLARYMQVLSGGFLKSFGKKIINIHHSFLPSFPGARPYDQAYEKGVKIIGATAHFVNEKLDDGPIIEQDVIRIDHEDDIEDLIRKGKMIERSVLARAVKLFIEDRIIEYGNKTIVFE